MAIDRKKIIRDLSGVQFVGGGSGLIEAFNVFVNQMPTRFWTRFADRITNRAPAELLESVEFLLVNAAHECGYHTGHGMITSDEWKAAVQPMVEKIPDDMLQGAFAVFSAWGWANIEMNELVPGERMVCRAYDYYEAEVVCYGARSRPAAYMLRGICAAFMDLAYGGPYDVTGKTGLYTFGCKQTKGIECGDEYGEFVVTKL